MIRHLALALLTAASLLAPALSQAQANPGSSSSLTQLFPTTPVKKPDGTKWRIGYVESGNYDDYQVTLGEIADGLQSLGWLRFTSKRPEELSGHELWNWLAANTESAQLQFKADAYWQPGNFDTSQREPMRAAIAQRVKEKGDIDLMIAMGTWAGQEMRALGPPIPTIVGSTSDPIAAGIIDSAQDSGRDLLHARVEPEIYQHQLRLFHEIVPFKTLGIVYEDTAAGRTYAGIGAVQQVSRELDFTITDCHAPSSSISTEATNANIVQCYQKLADKHVDAVYVTSHHGVNNQSLPGIARILRQAKIPSFSMVGSKEVRLGLLLSLARPDISYVGLFHAETMARIFNGAQPRQLSQIWIDPPKIALNLSTARIIGFDPPIDILLAADEVYEGK